MKLLEYEAKRILAKHDIPLPSSYIAGEVPEFLPAVIKSQVPIGGRGKAGGVRVAYTTEEYKVVSQDIRALSIKGFTPTTLLAEEALAIKRELYISLLVDRAAHATVLMAHTNGGVEVESNNTDDFLRLECHADNSEVLGQQLAEYFELDEFAFALQDLVKNLYDCFVAADAILLEINPLIVTEDGRLLAGDCKMELDDAAAFRHPEWQFEAQVAETNFVTLDADGQVATIANGAGLAMATVDAVADAGMKPANFLDIGGGANEASVGAAFTRIMQYPNVSVIIINIFAGITRCDEVARAIIAAKSQLHDLPPLYIRLAGTNFESAVELLAAEHIATLATLDECIASAKKEFA